MTNDDGLGEAMLRDAAARAYEKPLELVVAQLRDMHTLLVNHEERLRALTEKNARMEKQVEHLETRVRIAESRVL